jgi:hypothetical protein
MDDFNQKPTTEQLGVRVAILEAQVSKLDRLVYKLFEERKRAVMGNARDGASSR